MVKGISHIALARALMNQHMCHYEKPQLELAFEIRVKVSSPLTVGYVNSGVRRIVPILGGTVCGPKLNGKVLPVGADFQLLYQNGRSFLDARYAIQANNSSFIYVVNKGIRRGSQEDMDRLARGEHVDGGRLYFHTTPLFEAGSDEYMWLMENVFVSNCIRNPDSVIITVYQVV